MCALAASQAWASKPHFLCYELAGEASLSGTVARQHCLVHSMSGLHTSCMCRMRLSSSCLPFAINTNPHTHVCCLMNAGAACTFPISSGCWWPTGACTQKPSACKRGQGTPLRADSATNPQPCPARRSVASSAQRGTFLVINRKLASLWSSCVRSSRQAGFPGFCVGFTLALPLGCAGSDRMSLSMDSLPSALAHPRHLRCLLWYPGNFCDARLDWTGVSWCPWQVSDALQFRFAGSQAGAFEW